MASNQANRAAETAPLLRPQARTPARQPGAAAADRAWEQREAADPENPGRTKTCFYNTLTGESKWDLPSGQDTSWRGRLANMRKKAGETHLGIWGEAALAVAPWGLFCLTSCLWSFFWHGSSGILGVTTVLGLLLLLVRLLMSFGLGDLKVFGRKLGNPPPVRHTPNAHAWAHPRLFISCMLGVSLGAAVGYYNYQSGVVDYWSFFEHWHYTNVWPEEPAAAHRDASAIVFSEGAQPDASKSAVFTVGHHAYCAAPIRMVGQAGGNGVQFFAVGRDCCSRQPIGFTCGAAGNPAARAGLVVYNRTNFYDFLLSRDFEFYQEAAAIATARFQLAAATTPIFLTWTSDIEWSNSRIVWNAWLFLLKTAVLTLPLLVVLELGISRASAVARAGYGGFRKGNEATSRAAQTAKKAKGPALPAPVVFHAAGAGGPATPPAGTTVRP